MSIFNASTKPQIRAPGGRQTLNEQAYARLRHAIISGRLEPGTTLTLRQLAEQLGTSLMPVREAISRLAAENAVVVLPQRGIRLPTMGEDEAEEIWALRIQLEGEACARAARFATPEEVASMRKLADWVREAAEAGDLHAVLERNSAFQFAVYGAAHSPTLLQLIEILRLRSVPFYTAAVRRLLRERPSYFAASWHYHDQVVDAIEARDAVRARRAKQGDLRGLRDYVRSLAEDRDTARKGAAARAAREA